MRARWGSGAACCACLVAALLGCGTARYVPKEPAVQSTAVGRVTPRLLARTHADGDELTLETELAPGTRVLEAYSAYDDHESVPAAVSSKPCVKQGFQRLSIEAQPDDGAQITLSGTSFSRHVLLDVEQGGQRQCVSALVEWPEAWRREEPWEILVNMGADFNVAGEGPHGVGGARLDVFRWLGTSRLGLEVGLLNSEFCADEPCPPGEGGLTLPIGAEADTFFFSGGGGRDGVTLGAAFLGAGLRFIAYTPLLGSGPDSSFMLSPQAALRLVASFPPPGPDPMPAGLTLDHGLYVGPAFVADDGSVVVLFGFSIGVGWGL